MRAPTAVRKPDSRSALRCTIYATCRDTLASVAPFWALRHLTFINDMAMLLAGTKY